MVADPVAHRADFLELPEIEAAAPDEGLDRREEILAERAVARRGAAADKRRLLPRQRFGFIIGDRCAFGQHDRRHLGMRTQAQVDAQHMAVGGARRQNLDHAPCDPHRRLVGVVARTARQRFGVEDQDRVDVRRIIEFVAAEFAECDHRQPARLFVRYALGKGGRERGIACRIGEFGQEPRRRRDIMLARQIAEREQQRHPPAPLPQRAHDVVVARRRRRDVGERRVGSVREEARHIIGVELGEPCEERRVGCEPVKRGLARESVWCDHRPSLSPATPAVSTPRPIFRPGSCFRRRTAPARSPRAASRADTAW
ncbi:hypothetical protein FG95_02304 [Sphingopyxis sp. LC363]|nr:hypothetical protein FG95_02304 [Sphingopyxis sp. LC363]